MSIGALLGGAINRYGEKNRENWDRQKRLEEMGQRATFDTLLGHYEKNYDTMLPEEQEAVIAQLETAIPGIKKGSLSPLVGGVRAIGSIIPPRPMTQEALGSSERRGGVEVTPSREPAVGGIAAPDSIEIGQIPQPGEIGSASIYQPMAGHSASLPAMTPGEQKLQRKQAVIGRSGMTPEAQKVANQALFGVPPSYETGMASIDQRAAAADQRYVMSMQKMNAIYGRPSVIKRGEEELFVWGSGAGAKVMSPAGPVPYVPEAGDHMVGGEGSPPLGSDFRQYIQRKEAELGRQLTAAEVQMERNRFPDMPFQADVKINGQDVKILTSRSNVLRGVGGQTSPVRGTGGAAAPAQPKSGKAAAPQIGPVPTPGAQSATTPRSPFGGMVFQSQTTSAEDKIADENEMAYEKIASVEQMTNPEFLGAIRGGNLDYTLRAKFPELASWVGRPDISPQEATFRAMHESMRNGIIHLISGAAVSPSEGVRIMGELPDPSRPGDWEGRVLKTKHNAAVMLNMIRARQGKPPVDVPALPTGLQGAPSGPTGSAQQRERRNKRTGEYQFSADGGATWQPGRLQRQ